ncbi:MAG: hypothetical protein DCE92_14445, partial [Alphaproteobacteria bacterium]
MSKATRSKALIVAALAGLALSACSAIPNEDGSWTMPGEDGGRIFQPPGAAAVVDGQFPARTAIDGSAMLVMTAEQATEPSLNAVLAVAPAILAGGETPIPSGP